MDPSGSVVYHAWRSAHEDQGELPVGCGRDEGTGAAEITVAPGGGVEPKDGGGLN